MRIEPAAHIDGHIAVPGDKSISHRALLLGALCEGETVVRGWGRSGDTESTLRAVRSLGVVVDELDVDTLRVHGVGLRGLVASDAPIDCGNAGTLARLVIGVLAFQPGRFELTGDESLSRRPMERVAKPLRLMGAELTATDGSLPLTVEGRELEAIDYELPVASAQVKSAILLAGVGARGVTKVVEPAPTRDHTELMLRAAGASVTVKQGSVSVEGGPTLRLPEVQVPGDISSAAPFLVAAALLPGSQLTVHDVGLNPRRTGILDVLERMGTRVAVHARHRVAGELIGDVEVVAQPLVATKIQAEEVPLLVDELPLFGLLAACARGKSYLNGAEELRLKESDRIEAVVDALRAIGAHARATRDGFAVTGVPTRPRGGRIDARGDHRIAMLGAVAGIASSEGVRLEGAESAAISFPGFFDLLATLVRPGEIG
jgi:3-phosphoshikimate 1-carboxyvinyltransferase